MSGDTKTRILDAALVLFNDKGSAAVSTNHIAEAAGLSPGNLYYHYRNKDEIIRALFGRIGGAWGEVYEVPADMAPSLELFEMFMRRTFEVQWQYRFFFRELPSLLIADPALAESYRLGRAAGFDGFRALLAMFGAAGLLTPPQTEVETDDVAQALWLVGDFWFVFNDVGGAGLSQPQMEQGIRVMRHILSPYIRSSK